MPRHSSLGIPTGAVLLVLSAMSGCAAPWDDTDEVRSAAERAASAFTEGTPDEAPLTDRDASVAAYEEVVRGLGTDPQVSVTEAESVDGGGRATLRWSWDLGADTWEYDAEVALAQAGDTWQVRWDPALVAPDLAPGDRLVATRVAADRGEVLGAGGDVLVEPRPVVRVGVSKEGLRPRQAVAAARAVAGLLEVDAAAYARRVRDAGERAFVEAVVLREADLAPALRGRLEAVEGALLVDDTLPLAPSRDFAAALLGSVGEATAEIVEESDGRVRAGDEVGVSGLQRRYDEQLAGTPGVTVERVPEEGEPERVWEVEPVAGTPLRTSLDRGLQARAQQVLADVGPASGLVALRPGTGEVLAAASGPGSEGYNTATFGQYAPGSTFKVVSSLALLRDGLTPQSVLPCPTTTSVDGRVFENYDDYPASGLGEVTLETAVANSCNTAFISQAERLGDDALAQAAASLGLGVDQAVGFPAYFGQVPPAETDTGAAADMIGQGTVLASPLAMATVVASVAAGETVLPRLLPEVEVTPTEPEQPLTAQEARQLQRMLAAVVERGSGTSLQGLATYAKTGTAEYGEEQPPQTHAWMVAARDDLAVAVFVETGDSGSGTAGPLLRDFLGPARG